ncbi:MAG: aminotransferase class V-fold PLP-dependent enzyme, partial [Candidatus Aminicenantes bacterium]|nr:aminotransferase class V-fold PLP-dependent enzyme [Candidatus Aminicenantes bacterium]
LFAVPFLILAAGGAAQKKKTPEVPPPAPSPADIARDESFWFPVQAAFDIDRSVINLNNGGVHPAPRVVMNALHRHLDFANGAPTHNAWSFLRPRKELVRKLVADTFGCSPEEIALVRNVTEALQIALLGIELKPGDEVLTTEHDYPSMKNALYQRQKRDGVVVRTFSFPTPPASLAELTALFERNVTERTKLILLCHITNLTGQIFPVKEICRLARARGIEVVVDGAHAFGHFDFKVGDLECDIYGANLHKWMMAPMGNGFLYVRQERIRDIWPLFPAADPLGDDIRKFEAYGTQQDALWAAVPEAVAFHEGIGAKNKEERLRYLREYWRLGLNDLPGFRFLTSLDPEQSCGIGTFCVEGADNAALAAFLLDRYRIITSTIKLPEGPTVIRVTPSVYTTLHELDVFVRAVGEFVAAKDR